MVLRIARVAIGFSAVFLFAGISFAQVDRSGLNGTVTDQAGRLLPGTHITAVQNSTQLQRESISDAKGYYSIPELPVGTYTVTVLHQGFKKLNLSMWNRSLAERGPLMQHFKLREGRSASASHRLRR